jgi:hypothetical protein
MIGGLHTQPAGLMNHDLEPFPNVSTIKNLLWQVRTTDWTHLIGQSLFFPARDHDLEAWAHSYNLESWQNEKILQRLVQLQGHVAGNRKSKFTSSLIYNISDFTNFLRFGERNLNLHRPADLLLGICVRSLSRTLKLDWPKQPGKIAEFVGEWGPEV